MRINRVECDQFAGLTNKEIELDKGLNIIVGENETGKSTMVDLVYQLLFKDTRISKNEKTDKDFTAKYFPKKAKGAQEDIDGTLVFETPNGRYKLKKEWKIGNGNCKLFLPDNTYITNPAEINKILAEEFKYRAGVYGEIVFASQKRNQLAIESIMNALSPKDSHLINTREDFASTLSQAALETGGVSLDKIEKMISNNITSLISHWDWDADAPEGGPARASFENAWKKEKGEIVKAYYEMDEVRSKYKKADEAERIVEAKNEIIRELHKKKSEIEKEKAIFYKYKGSLEQRSDIEKIIKQNKEVIGERKKAVDAWPEINEKLAKAKELSTKQKYAQIRGLYLSIKPIHSEYVKVVDEFNKLTAVEADDLNSLKDLEARKKIEEQKLIGMNLSANIKKLGPAEITITSITSGKRFDITEGEILISEAVNISIPGVMEMNLMPRGIDIEKVKKDIDLINAEIEDLYGRYNISKLEELQTMYDVYTETKQAVEQLKSKLDVNLGEKRWEDILEENSIVPEEIETEDEIKDSINGLCGKKTIDGYIGGLEATISSYIGKYKSVEELKDSIESLNKEMGEYLEKKKSLDDIPEKYQDIDVKQYEESIDNELNDVDKQIKECNSGLLTAIRNLDDKSAEEYLDDLKIKELNLAEFKKEYLHWKHIQDVFCDLKEKNADNPVEDIEIKFREYLGIITDGTLCLDSMDEKMSVQLTSGSNALTYNILSDGTKDTISLAFRLAMLEHLYPEGDGLALFDDPFTDMDVKRVEQSCKLIQKFAENNQVLFTTCDDKYTKYMTGNVITLCK